MDQRAFYQNVVMLTLSICNGIYVYHWKGDQKSAKNLLKLLNDELIDFKSAYERHQLDAEGISRNQWKNTLRSEISDSKMNIIQRAALRIAARHLRPLGYTKEFTREDANLTTNVGHIWSHESRRENFCYENGNFCGVGEV